MDTSDFKFVFLGQSVLRYEVPHDIYATINRVYESKYSDLKRANINVQITRPPSKTKKRRKKNASNKKRNKV